MSMTVHTPVSDYERVEAALRYLEEHFLEQPSLEEIAASQRLSPHHFQRVFQRWAGISPKRFLQFLTIDHARTLLCKGRSVLDVTYECGLSSPGRLHDLFVTVDAVTPGQSKGGDPGLAIRYGFHESPFGNCLIATTRRGICALSFFAEDPAQVVADLHARWRGCRLCEEPGVTQSLLPQIFPSRPSARPKPLALFLKGTNFQIKVWEALLRIPCGLLCSYSDLAGGLGRKAATRGVAGAVARNPVAYLIPCHRVIRKMGAFGQYRWGSTRKKVMVGWEMARHLQPS